MQDCLKDQEAEDPPLLPHLLNRLEPQGNGVKISVDQQMEDANEFTCKFSLNGEQAEALRATSGWLQAAADEVKVPSYGFSVNLALLSSDSSAEG